MTDYERMHELSVRVDSAYLERNRSIALLAKMAMALGLTAGVGQDNNEDWSPEWRNVVYIDLPTGQVSWHFHEREKYLFEALPTYTGKWDGTWHDEKHSRMEIVSIEQLTGSQ
ncbi:MAG: hypothetical protein RPU59_13890 [Candidatus Sedimenticola sp. (ex Thyasira tokunagai)]